MSILHNAWCGEFVDKCEPFALLKWVSNQQSNYPVLFEYFVDPLMRWMFDSPGYWLWYVFAGAFAFWLIILPLFAPFVIWHIWFAKRKIKSFLVYFIPMIITVMFLPIFMIGWLNNVIGFPVAYTGEWYVFSCLVAPIFSPLVACPFLALLYIGDS